MIIVESDEWANLVPEMGNGGITHKGTHPFIHSSGIGDVVYRTECPDNYVAYEPERKPFKRIHNPQTHEIKQIGLDQEIPDGFVSGGIMGKFSYGPKIGTTEVYNNGSRKIYLKKGMVIPEGFVKGLHYEGTTKNRIGIHNPITGEKMYVVDLSEMPPGFVKGIPPTTGKNVSSPYGDFKTISECMRILNLTRGEILKFIKNDPDNWKITNIESWQNGMSIKNIKKKDYHNDEII